MSECSAGSIRAVLPTVHFRHHGSLKRPQIGESPNEGSFCVPSQDAQDAIAKPSNGMCPWGWISSGSYCLRSGNAQR
jgi:hypothetical protein